MVGGRKAPLGSGGAATDGWLLDLGFAAQVVECLFNSGALHLARQLRLHFIKLRYFGITHVFHLENVPAQIGLERLLGVLALA